ncbi:hypothetical protein HJFPF1_02177 [Paramyrothecium foliicola]|nr:hypothetical protein HJFPF1_02177 [Paramyrothecium foliicola]
MYKQKSRELICRPNVGDAKQTVFPGSTMGYVWMDGETALEARKLQWGRGKGLKTFPRSIDSMGYPGRSRVGNWVDLHNTRISISLDNRWLLNATDVVS